MESRQEIEQMRVVELRDFLRRHQVPIRNVARNDGTPGPPRKSDLLAAALEVWKTQTSAQPETILQSTNPFQKRRSSPASLQRPRPSSVATEPTDMPQPTSSSLRASDADAEAPDQSVEPPSSTTRARRRSSSWVDPSLLAQLQAPSLSTQTRKTPAERNVVQRGRRDDVPTRATPRTVPGRRSGTVLEGAQTAFETPDDDGEDDVLKLVAPSSSTRPASRRSASTRLETPSPVQRRARPSDVVPVANRRTARDRTLLDVDENYLSDEDPDYEADGELAEDEDDSEASDYDQTKVVDVIDLTYGASSKQQQQAMHNVDDEIQPVHGKGMSRAYKGAGQEDIPFDSDAYESDRVHHSDRGSVIDTEDEEQLVDFTQWRSKDLRDWLRAHNIQFANLASKEELVGLVRARVLQMETMDEGQIPLVEQKSAHEPRSQEKSNLRSRRGITVPEVADDDDEVVFIREQSSRKSHGNVARSTESKNFTKNVRTVNGRRAQALTSFFVMSAVLVVLWGFALNSIFLSSNIPFCHRDSSSNYTESGDLCRSCPRNGVCVNGYLYCDSGFIQNGPQCVRDHMFDRFVEHLANYAARNLSELAGRAECGEDIETKVVYEDLGNYIVEYVYAMRKNDPSFFRVGLEDLQVLESAMHQAIGSLSEDEHGVVMDIDRRFYSTRPKISFKCKLKRKVMENLYEVLGGVVACFLLVIIRVKVYLIRRHQRQCEAAHQRALEVLRDQVIGFRHNEEDVAFVSDVMLREEVLGRPTKQVIKLWKDVEESLKSDARVLRKHQTIRGMPSYTFEYVGIRRSSGSGFGSFSRRSSSFGSRASLDSLDLRTDDDFDVTPRRGLGSYVMRFLDGR